MNEAENLGYGRMARRWQMAGKLRAYRDMLLRRWWVVVAGLVAGGIAVAGVLKWQETRYVSVGQMIVNVKLAIPQGSVFTEELSNFLGTQAALMQSQIVVNRAYGRVAAGFTNGVQVPERPALKVTVSPRTTIFNLEGSGADGKFTREFVQGIMEEYIRLKRDMRKQASDSTVAGLTEEVLTLERELRSTEEQIAEFQGTNSMVWLEEQGNTVGNYVAGLNQRLEGLKSEHELLETLTLDQNVQRQDAGGAADGGATGMDSATNGVVNNSTLASDYLKARQQLLLMKAEQEDWEKYLRPKHPKMVAMAEEISRRERLLEIYRQQNAEQLEGRKASVALQIQGLEKEIKDWDAKIVEISRKAAQYQRLKSNAQRVQVLYQQLLATVQTLDSNKDVGAESVSIMEAASPPIVDTRKRWNNMAFAVIACIAGSLGLLLFLDRLDDRVNSVSDLEEVFEETVLAQIPEEKLDKKRPQLIGAQDGRPAFVEAYRNLRSSVLCAGDEGKRPRTLVVTSTIPDEGKSVTAANLGAALAAAGSRVLLVDADLRKGVLHARLGIEDGSGLSEALGEGKGWSQMAQATAVKNLWLLRRGRATSASGELFLGAGVRKFLQEAAAQYDFVVLDTPPVMAADDVSSLAPQCDGVLFVLRAEHTSARIANAALDLLYQRKGQVLGIVFNAVRRNSADYYYYKYKDYYPAYAAKG